MFDLNAVQDALVEFQLDGWLLFDFRGSNVMARRILDLADKPTPSRRYLYMIPVSGQPRKIVHAIEPAVLDHLPGEKSIYMKWQQLEEAIQAALQGKTNVAMEYAPRVSNPYISRVDAGTVELVRSFGVNVMPSGDLVQRFESSWDDAQWAMHKESSRYTTAAFDLAFGLIAERTKGGGSINESEVQEAILDHFKTNGLTTYAPPIVGVGPHSSDPHFETKRGPDDTPMEQGDFVLIDLWAKVDRPRGVYSDYTRVGYIGEEVPQQYEDVFQVVASARDAAIAKVRDAFQNKRPLRGFEVDDAARQVIEQAGYGNYFIHRLGHSIGEEVHGNGAHMDNLETHEERLVLPRTCFSIEPGIYLPDFGIRSEVDVYIAPDATVHVTGGLQTRVLAIHADPTTSGT